MQSSKPTGDAPVACDQVAILGADFPGMRIKMAVSEGDQVQAGQVLFHDRKRPEIAFVAPVHGQVTAVRYGAKRLFASLVLACAEPARARDAATPDHAGDRSSLTAASLIATLTQNGFWPSFIQRPFGGMPDPSTRPNAIFVTATAASKTAPDPRTVLAGRQQALARALEALVLLSDGPVFLCQSDGPDLLTSLPAKVRLAKFSAKPGLALAGSHVHRLHPVGRGRQPGHQVWTIGYQDALAIGQFLMTGQQDFTRMVAVRGTPHDPAKVVRLPLGARLSCVLKACAPPMQKDAQAMSGSAERAREAAFLGRYHEEVTRRAIARVAPSSHAEPIIAHAGLDRALAMNLLAVPLMRALSVGDVESAERLGCLELLEDDVAALSARCTSGTDYGRCLRRALDTLKEAA